MGQPIVSTEFTRLMDERLREVAQGQYKDLEPMKDRFFRTINSNKKREEFYNVGDVPDITAFSGSHTRLPVAPGYLKVVEPKEYSGAIQTERKFLDDEMYGVYEGIARSLMDSGIRVQDKHAVEIFDNAFSSAFTFQTHEEGVSMCSSSHTTKAGVSTSTGFDNAGTTALSKTAVEATRLLMLKFKSDIGERIAMGRNLALVVPAELEETAWEIVSTKTGMNTGDGNANFSFGRYEVIPYLRLDDNDTNNWFLVDKDKMKNNQIWVSRIPLDHKTTWDFNTESFLQRVYGRWGYLFTDWRHAYGHLVA